MDTENDAALAANLRRLETDAVAMPFDYDGLVQRQAARTARRQRRHRVARSMAGALVVAVAGASVWRLRPAERTPEVAAAPVIAAAVEVPQPRLVRAQSYFALAALEDHIARVDDALTVARLVEPRGADVVRLERARDELLNSYAQVRYAERVSANF